MAGLPFRVLRVTALPVRDTRDTLRTRLVFGKYSRVSASLSLTPTGSCTGDAPRPGPGRHCLSGSQDGERPDPPYSLSPHDHDTLCPNTHHSCFNVRWRESVCTEVSPFCQLCQALWSLGLSLHRRNRGGVPWRWRPGCPTASCCAQPMPRWRSC